MLAEKLERRVVSVVDIIIAQRETSPTAPLSADEAGS
eukprot:SAG31_NODE_55_length_29938_cov_9.154027_28_plen_37_part_00